MWRPKDWRILNGHIARTTNSEPDYEAGADAIVRAIVKELEEALDTNVPLEGHLHTKILLKELKDGK